MCATKIPVLSAEDHSLFGYCSYRWNGVAVLPWWHQQRTAIQTLKHLLRKYRSSRTGHLPKPREL
jgi:hypothetical protein